MPLQGLRAQSRDLGAVLKLQAEVANALASALKVTLPRDVAAKIESGGTRPRSTRVCALRRPGWSA